VKDNSFDHIPRDSVRDNRPHSPRDLISFPIIATYLPGRMG
jgi:hypothetical protein